MNFNAALPAANAFTMADMPFMGNDTGNVAADTASFTDSLNECMQLYSGSDTDTKAAVKKPDLQNMAAATGEYRPSDSAQQGYLNGDIAENAMPQSAMAAKALRELLKAELGGFVNSSEYGNISSDSAKGDKQLKLKAEQTADMQTNSAVLSQAAYQLLSDTAELALQLQEDILSQQQELSQPITAITAENIAAPEQSSPDNSGKLNADIAGSVNADNRQLSEAPAERVTAQDTDYPANAEVIPAGKFINAEDTDKFTAELTAAMADTVISEKPVADDATAKAITAPQQNVKTANSDMDNIAVSKADVPQTIQPAQATQPVQNGYTSAKPEITAQAKIAADLPQAEKTAQTVAENAPAQVKIAETATSQVKIAENATAKVTYGETAQNIAIDNNISVNIRDNYVADDTVARETAIAPTAPEVKPADTGLDVSAKSAGYPAEQQMTAIPANGNAFEQREITSDTAPLTASEISEPENNSAAAKAVITDSNADNAQKAAEILPDAAVKSNTAETVSDNKADSTSVNPAEKQESSFASQQTTDRKDFTLEKTAVKSDNRATYSYADSKIAPAKATAMAALHTAKLNAQIKPQLNIQSENVSGMTANATAQAEAPVQGAGYIRQSFSIRRKADELGEITRAINPQGRIAENSDGMALRQVNASTEVYNADAENAKQEFAGKSADNGNNAIKAAQKSDNAGAAIQHAHSFDNVIKAAQPETREAAVLPRMTADEVYSLIESYISKADSKREFEVELNPKALGKITVKLVETAGKMAVEIATETEAARKLFQNNADKLIYNLKQNDVELQSYRVTAQPTDYQQNNNQQQSFDGSSKNPYHGQQQQQQQEDNEGYSFEQLYSEIAKML